MNYRNRVIWLIIVASLVRMIVAAVTELSNDEVYYWTYAQHLQWNYFDHPPLIAVLIRVFTGNLLVQEEFFVRLGAIACGAVNTWQMYLLGRQLKNEYAGWLAACLFTASVYGSILGGLMILPDAPQMVFWLWGVLLLVNIFNEVSEGARSNKRWLLFGLVAGLCIMSKVHGVFLWGGAGLYIMIYRRSLLKNPFLYLALLITVVLISPIYWWNRAHDFITLNYHGNRVGFFGAVQWDSFFRQLIGEFLYNNPVNVVLQFMALHAMRKMPLLSTTANQRILLMLSLPLVAVVWFMALFKDTLPHWTGPAYSTLIPLAAAYLAQRLERRQLLPLFPKVMRYSLALPAILLIVLVTSIQWLPVGLGSKDDQKLGSGDLLLDMSGWHQMGRAFDSLYKRDVAQGIMKPGAYLITDYWFPAAHVDYYVARPAKMPLIAVGSYANIHHYAWLNRHKAPLQPGQDAYYMAVSNYYDPLSPSIKNTFHSIEPPVMIDQLRAGKVVRHFYVVRLRGYQGGIPHSGVLP
ncbi:glycosyltransferase family 39 protein [Paraflavitalea sp. CAU 1676]|uniref:ArnT family glycosyltransferase n=1 Tax=Paraflavitalea sp. CAU 1676 TaxID=3032598 RepID=UPI0023DBFE85|nr:glycosyltransferase family 39 protein [Paraflavitalea sp. CAU 1676]MDF2187255.1 glycosyltransferase family 39 protein [Paraflavitalea sp. CAU 1676]